MKALPVLSFVVGALAFCSLAEAKPLQHGVASCYGPGFHGRRTANGERFNTHALTAAHKTLPFGSRVRVTNERTGRSVVVRINDRGPYVRPGDRSLQGRRSGRRHLGSGQGLAARL